MTRVRMTVMTLLPCSASGLAFDPESLGEGEARRGEAKGEAVCRGASVDGPAVVEERGERTGCAGGRERRGGGEDEREREEIHAIAAPTGPRETGRVQLELSHAGRLTGRAADAGAYTQVGLQVNTATKRRGGCGNGCQTPCAMARHGTY